MTITMSTPVASIMPDMPLDVTDEPAAPAAAASVADVISSVNATLRSAGGAYADYSCKTVSWDDVTRGTVGGALSSWGANITDTRLYAKGGQQLYTCRSDNFNEKLGKVTADELAIISGNQTPGGGPLTPITLRDLLRNAGKHGAYAGLDSATDLSAAPADAEVSIRFMTTFLPVSDDALATLEFAPEMYQYQTRTDSDPANLLLLATTQGVAVQANGAGATRLYNHAVEPSKQICRYWFEAERSTKQVGGAQVESKEEAMEAAKRGKATASVIGTRSMGTRFNVLMTIQVPLKQQAPPPRRGGGFGAGGFCGGGFLGGSFSGAKTLSKKSKKSCGGMGLSLGCAPSKAVTMMSASCALSDCEESDDGDWSMDLMMDVGLEAPAASAASPCAAPMSRSRGCSARRAAPPVGRANAARVSRGSMVDKLNKTVHVKKPTRDASQHVTVTVVIYNTVAGGVPSTEDVKAAVDDMEQLYASCGWKGRLASDGASFMKKELTLKDAMDIEAKLATQPYVPPAGAMGLVVGGDVFPVTSGQPPEAA